MDYSANREGKASKITEWVKPGDSSGEFKRQSSVFRDWISKEPGAKFPAEKGRYHLYISYACPWANRTLIARKLKGLEDFISFSSVHWHMGEKGWRFPTAEDTDAEGENVVPDPVSGHEKYTHLRDLYFGVNPNYSGRFTVPVLFDKKANTIVNNESSEILRMLGHIFDDQLPEKYAKVDLYPENLRGQIEEAHEWTYDKINNGVYKSGFATTQAAYEKNVTALFEALDKAEKHLAETDGPYFFGNTLTEVDVRLWVFPFFHLLRHIERPTRSPLHNDAVGRSIAITNRRHQKGFQHSSDSTRSTCSTSSVTYAISDPGTRICINTHGTCIGSTQHSRTRPTFYTSRTITRAATPRSTHTRSHHSALSRMSYPSMKKSRL